MQHPVIWKQMLEKNMTLFKKIGTKPIGDYFYFVITVYRVTTNAQTLEKALFSNLNLTKS